MAYFLYTTCGQCGKAFTCNPHLVPSKNNIAFCKTCVEVANPIRVTNGLEPIKILPGAYEAQSEPTDNDYMEY